MKKWTIERFMEHVDKDLDPPCWICLHGWDKHGYGRFKENGKDIFAHRLSYRLFKGTLDRPEYSNEYHGFVVSHTCNNPSCVNPDHLVGGSQKDNMEYASECNRMKSGTAKLSLDQALELRKLHREGVSAKELQVMAGISKGHIYKVLNNQVWREANHE